MAKSLSILIGVTLTFNLQFRSGDLHLVAGLVDPRMNCQTRVKLRWGLVGHGLPSLAKCHIYMHAAALAPAL